MRNSIALAAGAAALVGLGVIARPGERVVDHGRRGIVVVPAAAPADWADSPLRTPTPSLAAWQSGTPGVADGTEPVDGGPGIWATPAEFDAPEPTD